MTTGNLPMHYRLENITDQEGVHLCLKKWHPISETPKGYWVGNEYYLSSKSYRSLADLKKQKCVRWVSKNSERGFCKKDLSEAVKGFIARKQSQILRLELQLQSAQLCFEKMDAIKALEVDDFHAAKWGRVLLGRVDAIDNFSWDY